MSTITTTTPQAPISRDEFRSAIRRNVRTLLGMCDIEQQDLATAVRLSKSQLSDRLTCSAAWKDEELLNVARAFGVSYGAIVAQTPEEFRQALTALEDSPRIHDPLGSVQLDLFASAA